MGGFRVKRKERGEEVQQYRVASRCRGRGRERGMELAFFLFLFSPLFFFFFWLALSNQKTRAF